MIRHSELLTTIDAIYASALDFELWPTALAQVCEHLGSTAMNLVVADRAVEQGGAVVAHYGFDPDLVDRYNEHYVYVDPVNRAALTTLNPGGVVCSNQLMSDEHWKRTELYNDLAKPFDVFYLLGGMLARDVNRHVGLGLLRAHRMGPFDTEDLEIYAWIAPHLNRAVAIQAELMKAKGRTLALEETLQHLGTGVVLFDGRGKVVLANRAAEQTFASDSGLQVSRGDLVALSSDDSIRLRGAIRESVRTGTGKGFSAGAALTISGRRFSRSLQVLVTPLAVRQSVAGALRPVAAAFIFSSRNQTLEGAEILQALYALTPTEAGLAVKLAQGHTLSELSELFGISLTTVKTHLRSIFAKTDTRRQAQLVSLLLRGPLGTLKRLDSETR